MLAARADTGERDRLRGFGSPDITFADRILGIPVHPLENINEEERQH